MIKLKSLHNHYNMMCHACAIEILIIETDQRTTLEEPESREQINPNPTWKGWISQVSQFFFNIPNLLKRIITLFDSN